MLVVKYGYKAEAVHRRDIDYVRLLTKRSLRFVTVI
jgi:hypothetical protein